MQYANDTIRALHDAVREGNLQGVLEMLSKGADVENADLFTFRPIHIAAGHGHLDIVKALIARGCNVNAQTCWVAPSGAVMSRGMTALHAAASKEDPIIVLTLIRAGANVNVMDHSGEFPLHIAAMHGRLHTVKALVSANADVNAQGTNMKIPPFHATPLICAVAKNFEEVAKFLVQNGAVVNATNSSCWAPLHFAASEGNINITKLLVQNKAAVNAKTEEGLTPLHIASRIEVCQFLINSGADVNASDNDGLTPLLRAVQRQNPPEIVRLLIAKGASVNAKNDSGRTPLHLAADIDYTDIVDILIENKADVNAADFQLWTPLHLAANEGNLHAVKSLIASGAQVDARTEQSLTPLHIAHHIEVSQFLINSGADVNACDDDGLTPLLHAVQRRYPAEIVRLLIAKGASVNVRNKSGRTPLHLAADIDYTDIFDILIENKADVNAADIQLWTPLHIAANEGNLHAVKTLIASGAQVNVRTREDITPLYLAASLWHVKLVKYLLAQGAEVNAPDRQNLTPLHVAACGDSEQSKAQGQDLRLNTIKVLIENGANVNAKGIFDEIALHAAIRSNDVRAARYLLENGSYYDVPEKVLSFYSRLKVHSSGNAKSTKTLLVATKTLFQAVKGANCEEIEKCIHEGAPVNSRSIKYETSLMYACWKGHTAVVHTLIKNGANVNLSNSNGITPLHYAAKFGHHEIVCVLLQHGAVYNARTKTGKKTPLHFAQEEGKKVVSQILELIDRTFIRITESDDTLLKLKDINTAEFLAIKNCKNANEETLTQVASKTGYQTSGRKWYQY